MQLLGLVLLALAELDPGLPGHPVGEQSTAHTDPAVDPPDGEVDPDLGERPLPGGHVLVHAVEEGAVEVEDEGRVGGSRE